MFFLISNLYNAYKNVDHIIGFIKHNFFLPTLTVLFSFFTDFHGLGSGKMLSSHSFCFFFPYFSIGCPLYIFHLPPLHLSSSPIFSYPTARSPSILAVRSPFLASLMFFHPFSSTLFTSMSASILTMWPTHFTLLLTNLPVELFCCITYFRRSFILLSSNLFVRVIRQTKTNHAAAVVVLSTHCHQIQIKACLCNTSSQDFPFQLFQNVSVQHDSL